MLDQQRVDLLLRHRVRGGLLADVDVLGARRVREQLRVGRGSRRRRRRACSNNCAPADGDQAGVARAGADEVDDSALHRKIFLSHQVNRAVFVADQIV